MTGACHANADFAREFDIALSCDLPDAPVEATADGARLHHVLTNLISNVCKVSYPGETVTLALEISDPHHVAIRVTDQGIGIPKNAIETVFDPFSQIGSTHRNRTGSTGLGLSIVKTIVEAHGGNIAIDSTEGQGTCVCFTVPRSNPVPKAVR